MGTLLWLIFKITRSEYWFKSQRKDYQECQRRKAVKRANDTIQYLEDYL
jgi:hypothetical protein